MVLYVVALLSALSAGLLVTSVAQLVPAARGRNLRKRLERIATRPELRETAQQKERRKLQKEQIQEFLEAVGRRISSDEDDRKRKTLQKRLIHAGFRHPNAAHIFTALRVVLAVGLGVAVLTGLGFLAETTQQLVLWTAFGGLLGWMGPFIYLNRKVKSRQSEIQRALPDALDLMVVCVEAGLGLNQALQRVAGEMDRLSEALSDELLMVTLEIRAGTPREDALRNFGKRTGLTDVQSFTSMLIQTERFGTSVANALRVHSEELRTKRRQQAEEQAAKAGIKILFPLVFFVFPAIFVVLLGPAVFPLMNIFN